MATTTGRIALVLLGIVLALLVLEVTLQVAAWAIRASGSDVSSEWLTGNRRILCLGDSNTYGLYLDREEAYPQQLEALWNETVPSPKIEVLNLGFPGMNSSRILRDFPRMLATLRPDTILLLIGANDFWTAPAAIEPHRDASPLRRVLELSRVYKLFYMLRRAFLPPDLEISFAPEAVSDAPADTPCSSRRTVGDRPFWEAPGCSATARYAGEEFELGWEPRALQTEAAGRSLEKNLVALERQAAGFGAELILLDYPSRRKFYGEANGIISRVARETGAPLIDLASAFERDCPDASCSSLLFPDAHPTARGYHRVAQAIAARMAAKPSGDAAAVEGRAQSGSPAAVPAVEPQTFRGRGVYYFDGPVRSPLGDIGSRSPFATNRIALDDEFSEVRVDRANRRILFRNEHRYGLNELVGCLTLLGRGTTASGREVPVAAHLKIHKTGNRFMPSLHPHPSVREKVVAAVFAPFDVVLSNGKSEKIALTPARAIEAVREPELSARLAKIFVQVTDHLEGATLAPEKPGSALVDLSIGFGGEKINMQLARVRLLSRSAENGGLIRRGSLGAMLEKGDWEFRVDSLSPYVPKWEFDRNFFLFGIERVPALENIARRGLLRGETLVVGLRGGKGYIGVNEALSEIPNPADVTRAYLEFHFVGGVVAQQVADLSHRLQ